jgi:hypothetical protein
LIIRGLEKLGLVWNVRLPTSAQMARRQVVDQPANSSS